MYNNRNASPEPRISSKSKLNENFTDNLDLKKLSLESFVGLLMKGDPSSIRYKKVSVRRPQLLNARTVLE